MDKTTIIVGAGPAGLCSAINLKYKLPQSKVIVIEKAEKIGNHNLSGAAVEIESLVELLNKVKPKFKEDNYAKKLLKSKVEQEKLYYIISKNIKINITPIINIANKLNLNLGKLNHKNDYILSISELTKYLKQIAEELEVIVVTGFGVEKIIYENDYAIAVKLIDQGLDENREKQPNYMQGEIVELNYLILAEGSKGYLTKDFISKMNLTTKSPQIYSLGIKEVYETKTNHNTNKVMHTLGYPLFKPIIGPDIFGGTFMYFYDKNKIAIGIISGSDWKYKNFNAQEALEKFMQTRFISKILNDAQLIEAGAKLIPEGGYYSIPRNKLNHIGNKNIILIGDTAGFVDMQKIKGVHLSIFSGILAADAICESNRKQDLASNYTNLIEKSQIIKDLIKAKNFRQTITKFGSTIGFLLSVFSSKFPQIGIEDDYKSMSNKKYKYHLKTKYDKMKFVALAKSSHREDQPNHLEIIDNKLCLQCEKKYDCPCITFCPAGVYEKVDGEVIPQNPSNCLHCKTCEHKCPYQNIKWHTPEGTGGPRYENM